MTRGRLRAAVVGNVNATRTYLLCPQPARHRKPRGDPSSATVNRPVTQRRQPCPLGVVLAPPGPGRPVAVGGPAVLPAAVRTYLFHLEGVSTAAARLPRGVNADVRQLPGSAGGESGTAFVAFDAANYDTLRQRIKTPLH
jgi:hypothetical protein